MTIDVLINDQLRVVQGIGLTNQVDDILEKQFTTKIAVINILEARENVCLSSNAHKTFLLSNFNELDDIDNITNTNFLSLYLQVIDNFQETQMLSMNRDFETRAAQVSQVVKQWARYSTVKNARGSRIALVSGPDIIENEKTVNYTFEVVLSTLVVYNMRRALAYFPTNIIQADEDIRNLKNALFDIDYIGSSLSLVVNS